VEDPRAGDTPSGQTVDDDPGVSADAGSEAPGSTMEDRRVQRPWLARWLLETALIVVAAWVLMLAVKAFVVHPFVIPSSSMEPTLHVNDYVLVNRLLYRFHPAEPGDIVVFVSAEDGGVDLIKRVVAVSGQTVDIRAGAVWVDGEQVDEDYVRGAITLPGDVSLPVVLPEGTVWVMGDNRTNSRDSRYIGPQPQSSIVGRAFAIYWPPSRIQGL
jgi:signal peptidase I